MAKYQINTDELDFDLVKTNIKTFLRSQEVFSDYDYEGSAMSVLIDLLAYNTVYNSTYNHLTLNEMFLDSASKYSSAVSLSKTIGYTPKSSLSARARITVNVSGVTDNPTVLTIPKGTAFRGTVGDVEYDFYTITDYTATNNLGNFLFSNIEVVEGVLLAKKYVSASNVKFIIPNKSVDLSTLTVIVQDSLTSSKYTKFTKVDDILTVRANDEVYFLKQREDTLYEVYFGNDTIGKGLSTGNVIHLRYMLSSGSAANGTRSFVYSTGFRSDVVYSISLDQVALGGSEPETLESIKFNAPRMYTAQNRAVTAEDYDALLRNKFPNIESLNIWGGQDHVPPTYGKVFIVAKPSDREYFLSDEKTEMTSFLTGGKNVLVSTPVMMDAEFLRLQLVVNVYYNKNTSRKTPGELASIVRSTITSYGNELNRFGRSFRFSKLSSLIDASDTAIVSNISTVRVRKVVEPIYNIKTKYTIRLENPIYQDKDTGETIWSTRFYIGEESDRCYFKDDGEGNIDMYLENKLGEPRFYKTIGTVNYSTGVITIVDILIRGLYDQEIEVMCSPLSYDVVPVRQYIVSIPPELVTVNVISDTEASSGIKQKHIFSASR